MLSLFSQLKGNAASDNALSVYSLLWLAALFCVNYTTYILEGNNVYIFNYFISINFMI